MTTLETVRPPTNDTEERLLDAALTLFAEKGYEAASVREIIEATGVTRPVLYYYIAEFMTEVAKLRFLIVQQVIQDGLDGKEMSGGDAASLSLIFCCIMDQHITVLARLPKPKKRLTIELADSLVDVFLYGVGSGKRAPVSLPPFAAG